MTGTAFYVEPMTVSTLQNTPVTPVAGIITVYNAAGGNLNPNLPALSGIENINETYGVQQYALDASGHTITFDCVGTDTFDDASTSIQLDAPGHLITFSPVVVAGVRVWKAIHGYLPLTSLDLRYAAAGSGGGSVSNATATVAGILKLAGDLGGTFAVPTVPGAMKKSANLSDVLSPSTSLANIGGVPTTDSRLSNARTPTAHSSSHATGGSDPLTPAAIGALTQLLADARYVRTVNGVAPDTGGNVAVAGGGSGSDPFATTTIPGILQLSGDLAGTYNAPTVPNALKRGNNLSDVLVPSTALGNLGGVATTDARLSNARTPTAHAASHSTGGTDPITPLNIGAAQAYFNIDSTHATSFALVAADWFNKRFIITASGTTPIVVTVNQNIIPQAGCAIEFRQGGTAPIQIAFGTGVTQAVPVGSAAQTSGLNTNISLVADGLNTVAVSGQLAPATAPAPGRAQVYTSGAASTASAAFVWTNWAGSVQGAPATGTLVIIRIAYKNSGTITAPGGWTPLTPAPANADNDGLATYYRVTTSGSETAPSFTFSVADIVTMVMFEVTNFSTTTPIDGNNATSDNLTLLTRSGPPLTPTVPNCMLITSAMWAGNAAPPTIAADGTSTLVGTALANYLSSGMSYAILSTSLTSVSHSLTITGAGLAGGQLNGSQAALLVRPLGS